MVDEKRKELIDHAFKAMSNAYAPYSKYHVGACIKAYDGHFISGVNIENASYGLTNCAERSALFSAYSQGYKAKDIEAIAIVSDGKNIVTPCGACRQVMIELLDKNTLILLSNGFQIRETNIAELLPMSFTKEDLL